MVAPTVFEDVKIDKTNTPINPNLVMFIDTATRYSGYAFYERGIIHPPTYQLENYGVVKVTNDKDWEVRCLGMTAKISQIIHSAKPGALVLEYPHFQGGSAKGRQASRSGSTLQLSYLCGRITMAWELYITKVYADMGQMPPLTRLIEYREWNGQLKKKHTCQRCKDFFDIEAKPDTIDDNYADAIMMGRWYLDNKTDGTVLAAHNAERVDL